VSTRTLHIAAAALVTAGLTTATVGLHPAAPDTLTRIGELLIIASVPLIVAAVAIQGAATAEQLAAARNSGYRMGLAHAALGLLHRPDGGGCTSTHGHLHAVPSDHQPQEKAQ
jgi:hypothetical protein